MPGDTFDRCGQIAIAVGDHGRKLVDLVGCVGRRLDLDPAADAVENDASIEGAGGRRQHVLPLSSNYLRVGAVDPVHSTIVRAGNARPCRVSKRRPALQRLSGISWEAICSTRSTMLRRSLASPMRVKARVNARPSDVARKSDT